MKKIVIILTCSICLLVNSCGCKDAIEALADLITNAIGLVSGDKEVTVGAVVDIGADVKNTIDSFDECDSTNDANANDYEAMFLYRPNTNSDWENIGTVTLATPSIVAGELESLVDEFKFEVAGIYMLDGVSDVDNVVEERNENNNGLASSDIDGMRLGHIPTNRYSQEFKVVHPDGSIEVSYHDTPIQYFNVVSNRFITKVKVDQTHLY